MLETRRKDMHGTTVIFLSSRLIALFVRHLAFVVAIVKHVGFVCMTSVKRLQMIRLHARQRVLQEGPQFSDILSLFKLLPSGCIFWTLRPMQLSLETVIVCSTHFDLKRIEEN